MKWELKSGSYPYCICAVLIFLSAYSQQAYAKNYSIVDTGQTVCYDASNELVTCPAKGEAFYGQDAQHDGNLPDYTDNGDGTVTDNVTGLMWQQSPDTDGDGDIDADDKLTYDEAVAGASKLTLGGYSDWRLPTIKEQYSLMNFSGVDPSGYEADDISGLIPFIDTDYFDFAYGDTDAGERIIDSQYASSNLYVDKNAGGGLLFGVNFADGRIKGYGLTLSGSDKTFFVTYVRGNTTYGQNDFTDNGDGTITDSSTSLMWSQEDSGYGLIWEDALALVETRNAANYLGYSDWRLPNIKELHSIVDYTRSPGTTDSAAIDAVFNATSIINEAGQTDYPCYWSSTTHANWSETFGGSAGAYVAFGRAMGYMDGAWTDVHGAGAQRSDPKTGDPDDYPTGHGPQGDAIRIYNYARLVRNVQNLSQTQVSQLYVSIFGRASEGDGNAYWQERGLDMSTSAMEMLGSPAAIEYFGDSLDIDQAFVEHIYNNTLGKTIADDPDGIAYWVNRLTAGGTRGNIVVTMAYALVNEDFTGNTKAIAAQNRFNNRVEVCNYTANTIATCPDVNDLSAFIDLISGVTDDPATVEVAKTLVDVF